MGLKSQDVDALSNLQQHTWSSLNCTLRAPLRYWIATAMDIIDPQMPDSGQHFQIQSECRRRSGTLVINESKEKKKIKNNRNEHKVAPCRICFFSIYNYYLIRKK